MRLRGRVSQFGLGDRLAFRERKLGAGRLATLSRAIRAADGIE